MLERRLLSLFYNPRSMHHDRSQSLGRYLKPQLLLPMSSVFRIIPTLQGYDWGKRGSESKVAQLAIASKLPDFQLDEKAPYAEVIIAIYSC